MRVLCVVFVVVSIGQACQGALLPRRHISILRPTRPDPPEPADPATHRELKSNNFITLKNHLQTVIEDENKKFETLGETGGGPSPSVPDVPHNLISKARAKTGPHRSIERPGHTGPRRPHNPLLKESLNQAEDGRRHMRQLKPRTSHVSPVDIPEEISRRTSKESSGRIVTVLPNVSDLCPDENGKNPLDPCTCMGVGGNSGGQISINCSSELDSLDQLQEIFQNTSFPTTHVFKFTLQGSIVDGALSREIWGPLDFQRVVINNNKITDVDNGAFIASNDTLISLDLANNEIKNFIAMYNDLPNLLYLNLQGNNISTIYSEDFLFPSLTELNLSYNQITSIGKHAFAGLQKLVNLDLSYNQLVTIGDERFTFINHDFSNALVIDLSYNNISTISDTAFLGVQNVEIHFEYNQLHTLREEIFYPIIINSHYYASFYFTGNEMVCDCEIKWVFRDGGLRNRFDDFLCVNNGISLYLLTVADLGNCPRSREGSYL